MLAIILLGSAAFSSAISQPAAQWLSIMTAFLAALDLVYAPSVKVCGHEQLHRDFASLAMRLNTSINPSEDQLIEWANERMRIECSEPPTFLALEADCWNEVARAWGKGDEQLKLKWRHRRLKHFVRFEGAEFPPMNHTARCQ